MNFIFFLISDDLEVEKVCFIYEKRGSKFLDKVGIKKTFDCIHTLLFLVVGEGGLSISLVSI